jgi:PhnB protein
MAGKVRAVPEGFTTVTPHIVVKGAAQALEFYKKAFGAEEVAVMRGPDGQSIMHAEVRIGNGVVMMCDEFPQSPHCKAPTTLGATTFGLHLYVEDCDKAYDKAIKAGATSIMPPSDMFWGDRYGKLKDPFGHEWAVATHQRDVTPDECMKAMNAMFAGGDKSCGA